MSLHVLNVIQQWGSCRTYMEHNTITLSVVDWSKFNPRTDSKRHTWFRFENDFYIKTSSWTNEERQVFMYVCCQTSQAKTEDVEIDLNLASYLLKQPPEKLSKVLTSLNNRGFIVLKSNLKLLEVTSKLLEVAITEVVPTLRNDTKRNDTIEGSTCAEPHKPRRLRGPISQFQEHVTIEDMLCSVTMNLQTKWIEVYGDVSWLRTEILKAVAWEAANPRKVSKDKGRFLTNWFSRGWEKHRVAQPGGGATGADKWLEKKMKEETSEI